MRIALLIFASAIIFLSFSKKEKEEPFFYKNIEKGMCLIPGGSMNNDTFCVKKCGLTFECPIQKLNVDSFYLCNHEVSNLEYREFINSVRKDSGDLYKKFLPDTSLWNDALTYGQEYIEWYFRHPAYNNYPVVGITHEQAKAYCAWLTKKYMDNEKRKFKNAVFKLPTINQWTYAAKGGAEALIPFKNGKLTDKKGEYQASFRSIDQLNIRNNEINYNCQHKRATSRFSLKLTCSNNQIVPLPIFSNPKSHYNLYKLAGNVEEYVAEKGITKGGGWKDTGYFLQNCVSQTYDSTNAVSTDRGFRVAMEIVK